MFLILGVAYLFFGGSKYQPLMTSLLGGFLISLYSSFSFELSLTCLFIFGALSRLFWTRNSIKTAFLYTAVGIFAGQLCWVMFCSYFLPLWTLKATEIISGLVIGFLGLKHISRNVFGVLGTAFVGANLIATSIGMFAGETGLYWNLLIQVACIVTLGVAGCYVQDK